MLRRLLVCVVVGLCTAPAAFAAGPDPGVVLGGLGVAPPGGKNRYVAIGGKSATTVTAIRRSDGRVLKWRTYRGSFGIPSGGRAPEWLETSSAPPSEGTWSMPSTSTRNQ